MLGRVFGTKASKKEAAERKAKQQELAENRDNLFEAAEESVNRAVDAATNLKDGVPLPNGIKAAEWDLDNAQKLYTQLEVAEPLSEQEAATMSKLQTHQAGVKSDPGRFKATWTKDKQETLQRLEARDEVARKMGDLRAVLGKCTELLNLKREGDAMLRTGRQCLLRKHVGEPRRIIPRMLDTYNRSGFTRGEEAVKMLREPMSIIACTRVQAFWRGVVGRRRAKKVKWTKDKGRLEASSLFHALDADHGGSLSREELSEGLAVVGYSGEEIEHVLGHLDADGDGEITEQEFIDGFREALSTQKLSGSSVNLSMQAANATREDEVVKQVFWDDEDDEEEDTKASKSIGDLPVDGGGTVGRDRTGATTHLFAELHFCAKKGDVIRCWALVNRTQVPVNARTTNGTTALHFAAWEGQVATINVLVALGAQLDCRTHGGYTPLHCAAGANHVEAVEELVRVGADVNVRETRSGASPLHWAAREGHVEAIEALTLHRARVDYPDNNRNTPMMYAARHAKTEAVALLLSCKASLDAVNSDGRTALFHAAEAGATDTALRLVSEGADVGQKQEYGRSAADLAETRGFAETARVLRERVRLKQVESGLKLERHGTIRHQQINDLFLAETQHHADTGAAPRHSDVVAAGRRRRKAIVAGMGERQEQGGAIKELAKQVLGKDKRGSQGGDSARDTPAPMVL